MTVYETTFQFHRWMDFNIFDGYSICILYNI